MNIILMERYTGKLVRAFLLAILTIFTILAVVNFAILCTDETEYDSIHCMFNEESWQKNNAFNIIAGILTASAAILAITFIITEVIISNISRNYSSHILDNFLKQLTTHSVFYAWIIMATLSAMALFFIDVLDITTLFIVMILLVDGFVLSLALFVKHYHIMIQVVNPFTTIDLLGDREINYLRGVE